MNTAVHDYICAHDFDRPTLVMSIAGLDSNYRSFKAGMPTCHVHYAVKANPHPAILSRLVSLGSRFDAASAGEIQSCIDAGAKPEHISFGNTVKRPQDITFAAQAGIDLFAVDSFEEVDKVAKYAPGSRVFVRILVNATQAEWPLSRKFGCDGDMAISVMDRAKSKGLEPVGISFHVGSQTRHPEMWLSILDEMSVVWKRGLWSGFNLHLLNVGGGFPSYYGVEITDAVTYGETLNKYIADRFPNVSYLMIEPGRGMVANLGSIVAEVLLVSTKSKADDVRWVYLNIGRFSGLAETESEAIKYQFIVPSKMHSEIGQCIIAGPTCDSADVLYEKHKVNLPVDLTAGDKVIINNTGAYTTTYSTVNFNGFPPLETIVI